MTNLINRQTDDKHRKKPWPAIILIGAVIAIVIISPFLGISEKIGQLKSWIEGAGVWGPLVFVIIYIVATVLALPGSVFSIAAGVIFGAVWGTVLVINAATLGAAISFLIARYVARGSITSWLADKKHFQNLFRLTEKHGAEIVAVTRLVPVIPFNILNYGFGLTGVKFRTYVGWSWLCMLPGTVLYVSGAGGVTEAIEKGQVPWVHVGVVIFILMLLAIIIPKARKKLKSEDN